MTNKKTLEWLSARDIQLEESFAEAIKNLAKNYQKVNSIKNIDIIYSLMGMKKQYLTYWKNNSSSTQTKKFQTECNLCSC